MTSPVPRLGRLLDAVGLLVFVAGAALYGWSWLGMRELREVQPVAEEGVRFAATARFTELWQLSRVGMWLMAGGAAVALAAAVVARLFGAPAGDEGS